MLFENINRSYEGPKSYIDGEFDYLNRSSRKEAAEVRAFLNYWVSCFPEHEAKELIYRLKSRDTKAFDSAAFEIILFAILSSLGCKIEIHPQVENNTNKRPDFLVTTPVGNEFYLEAVLASEFSAEEIAAEKRKNVVLQAIEKLDSPNFFIGINAEGNPDTPPSGKALRRELSIWLASLDPDAVDNKINNKGGLHEIPTMKWEHDGWKIEFKAIPTKPEQRGKGQRVIGFRFYGVRWPNVWKPIRDAIRSKGGRYGKLSKPFIVAINVDAASLDPIDEMQALFGQEKHIFNLHNFENGPAMRRAPNGAWYGPNGPQYKRVSAAWIFGNMNPWNLISRKNTLYINPWSVLKIPNELKYSINYAATNDEMMEWFDEKPLSKLLGLRNSWPE